MRKTVMAYSTRQSNPSFGLPYPEPRKFYVTVEIVDNRIYELGWAACDNGLYYWELPEDEAPVVMEDGDWILDPSDFSSEIVMKNPKMFDRKSLEIKYPMGNW